MSTRKKPSARRPQPVNPRGQMQAAIDPCGGVKIHAATDPTGGVAKTRKYAVTAKAAKAATRAT